MKEQNWSTYGTRAVMLGSAERGKWGGVSWERTLHPYSSLDRAFSCFSIIRRNGEVRFD